MKDKFNIRAWNDVFRTLSVQKRLHIPRWLFYSGVFFSVLVTYSQLQMIKLLNPLIGGIIASNFSTVRSITVFPVCEKLLGREITGNGELLLFVSVCIYALTLCRGLFQYIAAVSMGKYSNQAAKSLRQLIFQSYLEFGKSYFDRRNVGELTTVMSGAVKAFSSQMTQLQGLCVASLMTCVYLGVLLSISWKMTVVVSVIVILFGRLTKKLGFRIQELAKSKIVAEKQFGAKVHEVLTGVVLVKGFNKERQEIETFRDNSTRELNIHWSMLRWEALLGPMYEVSSTTTFLFISFAISVMGIISQVGPTNLFVFIYVVQQFIPTLNKINQCWIEFARSVDWNQELSDILDDLEKYKVSEGSRKVQGFENRIEIKELNFSYGRGQSAIKQLNCVISKGEKIALVGPSGAGKTTLINILLRLYDCSGDAIFIDGVDIREFEIASLREYMAFVSQEVFLFDATIMYNLTYGLNKQHDLGKILEIAEQTKVHEFVKELPAGYETIVGERGARLSGGQRQRIALARALLREAEIIMLDEPTSALDNETEYELVKSIREVLKNKTVITIAHRLSTVQNADRILFLVNGSLQGSGTFEDLLNTNLRFRQFVASEFKKAA